MNRKELNHIKWGVVLTYATLGINIVLSIIYTPVMLQILGQSEHGLYSTVSSTMSWLSLLGLGIGSSYIYFFSKYRAKNDDVAIASLNGLFIFIFSIIGFICLSCGVIIANNLQFVFSKGMTEAEYVTARKLALIVTVDMAIGFPASVFGAVIRANERYIQSKLAALFQNICTPLLTLPLLLSGYGSVGMVAATTIVDFMAYSFNAFYCFREIHMKVRFHGFEPGIMKGIFNYSVFIALNSLIAQFATGLDKIFITRYVDTAAASVYAIGCSLFTYYSAFSGAVSSVFATRIHTITASAQDDIVQLRKRLTEQFTKLGRIQFIIQMLLLTGIIFFGRAFIHLWAERGGQDYSNSYYIALLLCISSTIPLIQNIGGEIQRAQNKHRYRTLFYGVMTGINVILTIVLCQKWGEIGAAVGTAISTIVVDVIVMNIYYHTQLNIDILCFWKSIAQMVTGLVIPLLIGLVTMYFVRINNLLIFIGCVTIYTVLYCISMWVFAMNTDEQKVFLHLLKRKK